MFGMVGRPALVGAEFLDLAEACIVQLVVEVAPRFGHWSRRATEGCYAVSERRIRFVDVGDVAGPGVISR